MEKVWIFFTNGFAGGGSQPFNHFHAELATGQICSELTLLTAGKAKVVRPEQIRLLLERATRFAGGGSRRFNHFLAELTARADLFAAAGNCVAKKTLRTFRMSHGFDFATQNLGTREESSHLARKAIPSP